MILVTGASGHVGGALVAQLAAQHRPVRAMTRRPRELTPPPCAGAASDAEVEVVYGDCADPGSLRAAFDGVDRAFLMTAQTPGGAERPTHLPALVRAAQLAGVRHVVALSVYTGGSGGDVLADWNARAEAAVTAGGMDWTLLRPGRFMTNALQWAPQLRAGDTVTLPFAHRAAASVAPADVAAVALAALTTDGHRNTAHRLSGPQLHTPAEELAILARVLGRELRAVEPPPDAVRAGMLAAGTSREVVDAIVARAAGDDGTEVLPTVEQITGRPPTTFADFARAHAALFTRTATDPAEEPAT